jgi:protein-S-isoprenylcysteine O-methyltransferase Ste14
VPPDRKDNPGVIAPPPLIFAIPLIGGVLVGRAFPFQVLPRSLALVIGGALTLFALVLFFWALLSFRQAATPMVPYKPTAAIIDTDPFALTRNPVYLAMALLYVGITLLVNTVWPLLLLPFVLGLVQRGVIEREERYLEQKFGDEYMSYKSRVRRWL